MPNSGTQQISDLNVPAGNQGDQPPNSQPWNNQVPHNQDPNNQGGNIGGDWSNCECRT